MIYLASPYSHPDEAVRVDRWKAVCKATADLMRDGELVFSPIAHTHPIAEYGLPKGWDYWDRFDRWFIERCDDLAVLMLDGWKDSVGVQAEIKIAKVLGKPVSYISST